MKGKVKFFNGRKGFGFVAAEDGKEYFVHISGLQEGVRLFEDDAVTFDVEDGERGSKAVNVAKDESVEESGKEESAEEESAEEESAEETSEEESPEETEEATEEDSSEDSEE